MFLKTKYNNYLIFTLGVLTTFLGSTLEIAAAFSSSYQEAELLYLLTGLIYTSSYLFMSLFLANTFNTPVRDSTFLIIGGGFFIEVMETLINPVNLKYSDNLWMITSVRSYIAYLARGIMLFIITLIFSVYLVGYIKRTIVKARKYLAIVLFIELILILLGDGVYVYLLTSVGHPINQGFFAIIGLFNMIFLGIIIFIDPFLLVFFRGKVKLILIIRDDGVLLSEIALAKEKRLNVALIANLIIAITEFGKEMIFQKQSLEYIVFQKEQVIIIPYRKISLAIIGEDISENIKGFALDFLREYYRKFYENIEGRELFIPDEKEVFDVFIKELGRVVL